jgi:hypothetical protein
MKLSKVFRNMRVVEESKPTPKQPLALDKNSKFVYAKGSDVMKTFKRYGFVPPSEVREDYLFKVNRDMK